MKGKEIKILIVDDHPYVIKGIRSAFELENNFEICAEASTTGEAINLITKLMPDIVIVDISIEEESDGIKLVQALNSRFKNIKTLMLSMYNSPSMIMSALKAGANGFVSKKEDIEYVVTGIKTIMNKHFYVSPDILDTLIHILLQQPTENKTVSMENLSEREVEVLQLFGKGCSTAEIVKELHMRANTVESHKRNIKEKLGLKKGADLLKHAIKWNEEHKS